MEERTMAYRYLNKYRRYNCDMHVSTLRNDFFTEFDPDVFVKSITKANVNAAMIFLQSHYGYAHWPAKVGEMHLLL